VRVNELMIRNAMRDARLLSQQAGGISLPRVQQFVDRLLAGEVAPAIKVDGTMIVDGNHRYIAARILGRDLAVQPWLGGRPANAIPWDEMRVDQNSW
jgi:filamentous hemagglutinin